MSDAGFVAWGVMGVMYLCTGGAFWVLVVMCSVLAFIQNDGSRTGLPFWKEASRLLATILLSAVAIPIWPIIVVGVHCRGRGSRRPLAQDRQTINVPAVSSSDRNWHRRSWLVLLRARRERIATSRWRAWWRWTPCGTNRDTDGLRVGVGSLLEHDMEGGQGRVAHDATVLEFRQLLNWVVDHEEDGVFRNIVGYL